MLTVAAAEEAESQKSGGHCSSHNKCRPCITNPGCVWCSSQIGRSKCVHKSHTVGSWCDGSPVMPATNTQNSDPGTSSSQILPKYVKATLRVREEFRLNITYRKLDDYPVDLYYLMDLSYSMIDDKQNVSLLGDRLAAAMKNVTSNFRLGFGSFVDKVALPFVNTHPSKIDQPCSQAVCVRPYSFKNHMPLTDNTSQFKKVVADAPISGNVDHPEGGFDALMQAMVCTEEIKWRQDARHLLIMATDASFHLAGDGKLAGVVEPNDEKCHMKDGEYTDSLIYDYPSISQLQRQAHNNSITLIFAVTEDKELYKLYKSLIENIRGSDMGTLTAGSQNVINLVTEIYQKLVDSVKISHETTNRLIGVTYWTRCLKESGPLGQTNVCHKIHAKKNVTFEVRIKVPSCPPHAGEIWNETITFTPDGINEKTTIELQIHCGCPCEYGGEGYQENSTECSNHGNKQCGVCECNSNFNGQLCQCEKDHFTAEDSNEACKSNITGAICSGRGSCICNACVCRQQTNSEEEIYGKYCECDNFSCVRYDSKICSGSEKGYCDCGKCVCNPGWKGEDCRCRDSVDTCRSPGDDQLCSGFGDCECGKCNCQKGHSGQYCEDCMTCPGRRCKRLAKCVDYLVHDTEKYDEEQCAPQKIKIIDKVKHIEEKKVPTQEEYCRLPDDAGCSFVFTYEERDGEMLIRAEEEKECPAPVDLLGIVFGVIGGTVLIGLLSILIWKILTTIHDRREFAKFEKERALSKWERGDNPLYVQATSTFSNPTFGN